MNPINTFLAILLFLTTSIFIGCTVSYQPQIKILPGKEIIPEGIAIHPKTGNIYLSSLHQQKIIWYDASGNPNDLITQGQDGFLMGLGMKFSDNGKILWACTADFEGHTMLFKIDADNGSVLKTFQHDSAKFLNDLVITSSGDVFISDTEKGAVFLLPSHQDQLVLWLQSPQLHWANGISLSEDESVLFVASGDQGILRISIADKVLQSISKNGHIDYAIDGLITYRNQLLGVIGWPQDKPETHRVIRYYLNADHFMERMDTLVIGTSYLEGPTTIALHKNNYYVLAKTNLDVYNRNRQQIKGIEDSLINPHILKGTLH